MKKKDLLEEQEKIVKKLRSYYTKDELYEIFIQDSEEQPEKDTFKRNILLGFFILAILTILVLIIDLRIFSVIWIYFIFPFLSFLLVNRNAYSNGKFATYGRKLDVLMISYYLIMYGAFFYLEGFLDYYSIGEVLFIVGISLYIALFYYTLVKIIEKKLYGRRDAMDVKSFSFFKTKYDIDLIKDIIKSNIWVIDEIKEYEEHYEKNRGVIISLSNYLRFSMVSIDKFISVAITKESGKYIFQDEQTARIQKKVDFILREILNFRNIREDQAVQLEGEHRNLWFSYTDTPSRLSKILEERKGQVARLAVVSVIIISGLILISKMPSDSSTTDYLIGIWITFFSALLAWMFSTKGSKQ